MTLTDREKALVEAVENWRKARRSIFDCSVGETTITLWRLLAEAEDSLMKIATELSTRAYDPPKENVPAIPAWNEMDYISQHAFKELCRPTSADGYQQGVVWVIDHGTIWNKVRELTAKDSA